MPADDILVSRCGEREAGWKLSQGGCRCCEESDGWFLEIRAHVEDKELGRRALELLGAQHEQLVDALVGEAHAGDGVPPAGGGVEGAQEGEIGGAWPGAPDISAIEIVLRLQHDVEWLAGGGSVGRLGKLEGVGHGIDLEACDRVSVVVVGVLCRDDNVLRAVCKGERLGKPFRWRWQSRQERLCDVLAVEDHANQLNVPIGINGDRDWRGAAPHERGC